MHFYKKRNSRREKELPSKQKEKKTYTGNQVSCIHKTSLYVVLIITRGFPTRNCYRMTSSLSHGNELPNALLDGSRWPELLQENIPQGGQQFRRSSPNELLQGRHDT